MCKQTAPALFFFTVTVLLLSRTIFADSDATLSVKTIPDGVEVWLDDKYIGDSPITGKKLLHGKYILKLIDPIQHTSVSEEIFLQTGEPTIVEKTIPSKFGSLKVNTEPDGANISMIMPLGKTPLVNDFIVPGKYRLEINRLGGYKTEFVDVIVPKGDVTLVQKALEKKNVLDNKAIARLGFGLGTLGGFTVALLETQDKNFHGANGSVTGEILGICIGALCVISFEIVGFN